MRGYITVGSFTRANSGTTISFEQNKPDPDQFIVDSLLRPWVDRHECALPPPCPIGLLECARWWRTRMQTPERKRETYLADAIVGEKRVGKRWVCGYAMRMRNALMHFLAMDRQQRDFIVAGVTGDLVPYNGEPFEQYRVIYEETMKMRENPHGYVASACNAMRQVIGRIGLNGDKMRAT